MAKIKGFTKFFTIFLIILSSSTLSSAKSQHFSRTISSKSLKLKKEKLSHLHFYFHDIVSGKNPTAVRVAQANMTNTSPTLFGVVVMIDDPLTVGLSLARSWWGERRGFMLLRRRMKLGY
ncbi:Dirigent protein [Melia azedarach]|nr:Dirigent protein [Melia azedarach]